MKNKTYARLIAFLLIFSFIIPVSLPVSALGLAIGDSMLQSDITINNGSVLHNSIAWNASYKNRQTENYIEYTPNPDVTPIVAYGGKLYGRSTLTATADYVRSLGKQPVAAINGDFFNTDSGIPIGLVITDGILRTSDAGLTALGINPDGSVFIGTPSLRVNLTDGMTNIPIAHINKVRNSSGAFLYTSDFSGTTRTIAEGVDVLLSYVSEPLRIGAAITAVVENVNPASKNALTLTDGQMVLSVNKSADASLIAAVSSLVPGSAVTITLDTDDTRFQSALYAVGGLEKLVTNGVAESGLAAGAAPRTAVGVKADGTLVLYTIDGRQTGYSTGATLTELAYRMLELGCVDALNLDGGGSTSIAAAYPGDTVMTTVNKPSDGSLRTCANFIFLVNNRPADYNISHLFIYPYNVVMLKGASQTFSPKAVDSAYYPVSLTAPVSYLVAAQDGRQSGEFIAQDGVYTAANAGDYYITGNIYGISGSAKVKVVDTPQYITVTNEKTGAGITDISINPGEAIDLKGHAYYNDLKIVADDPCFTWEISDGIGEIDQNGLFTASGIVGSVGKITVSCGGVSSEISVTVGRLPDILESFESDIVKIDINHAGAAKFTVNTAMDRVKYGYKSGRIDYDFGMAETPADGSAKSDFIPYGAILSQNPSHLNIWVYGDGSGNTLSANVTAPDTAGELVLCKLDFSGWSLISAQLPQNSSAIQSIGINNTGKSDTGTVYIDQLAVTYGPFEDIEPPKIENAEIIYDSFGQMSVLSAKIYDNMESRLLSGNITVMYDGLSVACSFDAEFGLLTAALPPDDGKMHRLTVEASDRSGNRSRLSLDLTQLAPSQNPFSDMAGHWADSYTAYLYEHGIISGVSTDGKLMYNPNEDMTRLDFAVAVVNMLGVDKSAYSSVTLPFADIKSIPDWAHDYVKAVYSLGIINGRTNDGKLYFAPDSYLTRAEAMTVLGRMLPRGYPEPELTYSDSAEVQEWAAPFVRSMTGLQILSGSNNNIMPNKNISRGEAAKIIYMIR